MAIAARLPEALIRRIRAPLRQALDAFAGPITNLPSPSAQAADARRRPGRPPRPIVEFPVASEAPWVDPQEFHIALDLHMRRHDESTYGLAAALREVGGQVFTSTLAVWRRGGKAPQSADSLRLLTLIERR